MRVTRPSADAPCRGQIVSVKRRVRTRNYSLLRRSSRESPSAPTAPTAAAVNACRALRPSLSCTRVVMTAGAGGSTDAARELSVDVAAHAVANSSSRAVMYANTIKPTTGPNGAGEADRLPGQSGDHQAEYQPRQQH